MVLDLVLESGLPEMKISDPSFKFVISNSRRFKYIVELDLVWTNTGLILILYRKTPKSILLHRTNSVGSNEAAHLEPPHLNLGCLQFQLFSFAF